MKRYLAILLFLGLLLTGCSQKPPALTDSRRLQISAEADDSAASNGNILSSEELGGNFSGSIGCYGLKNVNIQILENTLPLGEAIAQGKITVEEMEAYAQIDAGNGLCKHEARSFNSLTVNIFTYPEYELRVINDLYETPDGQQHPIHEFDLADPGTFQLLEPPSFFHAADSMDTAIDREDWGLDFQVVSASDAGLVLSVSQSGGQHLGELQLDERILVFPDEDYTMDIRMADLAEAVPLPQNGSQEISLPWPEGFGELTPGDYWLRIYVRDIFDPESIHPPMRDYTDLQMYHIFFTLESP